MIKVNESEIFKNILPPSHLPIVSKTLNVKIKMTPFQAYLKDYFSIPYIKCKLL